MAETLLPELNTMKPWLVSTLLATSSMMRGGASATEGVDLHLIALAKEQGIPIEGFETAEAQVRLLASDPLEVQVAALRATLLLEERGVSNDTLVQWIFEKQWQFWMDGDLESLGFLMMGDEEIFFEQFEAELIDRLDITEAQMELLERDMNALFEGLPDPAARTEAVYESLIGARNRNWLPAIRAMFDRPGTFFIAVGAGHLTGAAALQTLIAQDGIEITRVQ